MKCKICKFINRLTIFQLTEIDVQYLELNSLMKRKVGIPREVDWKRAEEIAIKPDESSDVSILDEDNSGNDIIYLQMLLFLKIKCYKNTQTYMFETDKKLASLFCDRFLIMIHINATVRGFDSYSGSGRVISFPFSSLW